MTTTLCPNPKCGQPLDLTRKHCRSTTCTWVRCVCGVNVDPAGRWNTGGPA